jgi:O-succinylbenzoic acid--CoA ligase
MARELSVVSAADPLELSARIRHALTSSGPAVLPRAVAAASLDTARPPASVGSGVALVIETSGSTGMPKRVALSADALIASGAASADALGGQGQWLLALPAHYVAGAQVLVRSILAGTQPVILPPGHFDPTGFRDAARTLTAASRYVSLVPVQLTRLLDGALKDSELLAVLRRFDGILIGGQAVDRNLRERAADLDVAITGTYGSSETCGGCVYDGVPIGATRARAVGGALELSGEILADGYVDDPERTAASFHRSDGERWYRTGDLGAVNEGRVSVLGRADNVIISGGEKVLLDAVERSVRELHGLSNAVVVAAPSEEWGQVPVVVAVGSTRMALDELRAHVSSALGRAAAPARILTVESMPQLNSGKPDRLALSRLASGA